MNSIKNIMETNKLTIHLLIFFWALTEIIETSLYFIIGDETNKPSFENSFGWIYKY